MAVDINDLGTFSSINAVWKAHPEGGHEGDYLTIGSVKYRWNKYLRIWENASTVTPTPARLVTTVGGDFTVNNDTIIGDELKVRGDTYLEGDVKVEGMLYAKKVKQPNKGFFQNETALTDRYPSPEVGWWATVGDEMPGTVYRCETKGIWTNTGKTGGVDSEEVSFQTINNLNSIEEKKALSAAMGKLLNEKKVDLETIGMVLLKASWNRYNQIGADGTHNSGDGWGNWYTTDDIPLAAGQTIGCYVGSTGMGSFSAISIHRGNTYIPVVVRKALSQQSSYVEYTALQSCNVVVCTSPLYNPLITPFIMNEARTKSDNNKDSTISKEFVYIGSGSTRIDQAIQCHIHHTYMLVFDNIEDWTVDSIGSGNVCAMLGDVYGVNAKSYTPVKSLKFEATEENQLAYIYFRADEGCMIRANLYDITPIELNKEAVVGMDKYESEFGKGDLWVPLEKLANMIVKGHSYRFYPDKTSWEVVINEHSYNYFAFAINLLNGTDRTELYPAVRVMAGADEMDRSLDSVIAFEVPNMDFDRVEWGFRAAEDVEFGGMLLDITYLLDIIDSGNTGNILKLFPETQFLPKVATLKKKTPYGYSPVNTPLVLQWFSDIHGNLTNLSRILEWKSKYAAYIDDILNTGDTITDNWATYNADILGYFNAGGDKILHVMGNHDVTSPGQAYKNWSGSGLTINQIYNGFTAKMDKAALGFVQPSNASTYGYNFFYKDYVGLGKASSGVRLIVLDSVLKVSNITASGSGASTSATEAYESAQRQWFIATLEEARQLGYSVAVAIHNVTNVTEFTSDSGFVAYNKPLAPTVDNRFEDYLLDDVDDFIEAGGDFVAWLCGHVHTDHIGVATGHTNQVVIAITTASPRLYTAESNEPARINGTVTQDAFNLIGIDTYYKHIRMLRVGYNFDPYGRNLDMIAIDYKQRKLLR
ncbi:MAG: metallophosphoesterase [Bacteroidaceae bacterium]|nr:metallophosphoesterase [Bacteroidaceae bacterium]